MKTKSFYKAILAAAGVYTLWGFSFLASSVGQRVATPFVLLSYRFDIALLILLVPLVLGKARLRLRGKNVKMLLLLQSDDGRFRPRRSVYPRRPLLAPVGNFNGRSYGRHLGRSKVHTKGKQQSIKTAVFVFQALDYIVLVHIPHEAV